MKINRRKLLSLMGISPAVLAGVPTLAEPAKKRAAKGSVDSGKIEALNPKGFPPAIQLIPMAPRVASLDGKTIYLVSDGFEGADRFLHQIAIWFQMNMPSVHTIYQLKAGGLAGDDPKLWAEIKANGAAMIMAYGH
jgi:hypothetical protein